MADNKALWNRVCTTDPKAVKPITGKSYQGNSPRPYWLIERMTDEFAPPDADWAEFVKSERFERMGEFDVLHVAVVSVWYMLDGMRTETFDQMGGTKAAYMTAGNDKNPPRFMVDEDAGKKSVTDGMVKCFSMIGLAGDIFSGRWDDSKYVAQAAAHFATKPSTTEHKQDMSPKARALRIIEGVNEGDAEGAASALASFPETEYVAVWALIDTKTQNKLIAAWPETV